MPAPSRSPLSKRGAQLAAATVLGTLTVFLVLAVIALGALELHHGGLSTWLRP